MTLELVASHQDDDPTIDTTMLFTGTQLSIQANKLATTGLKDQSLEALIHQRGKNHKKSQSQHQVQHLTSRFRKVQPATIWVFKFSTA